MKEESKEPEIKLFGRKIVLPENGGEDPSGKINDGDCDLCEEVSDGGIGEEGKAEYEKQQPDEGDQIAEQSGKQPPLGHENPKDSKDPDSTTGPEPHPNTPPIDQGTISVNNPKPETEQTDPATNGPQKALKKPDKILPCPRCNSMNTKFCYYNNYNVKQPRHFCRSCQRYWTAGGTMRNVPVGAGRRKSKSSASSHCSHITISETLHTAGVEPPNSKSNTTILSFWPGPGPDSPLSESMASSLNLTSKQAQKNGEDTGGRPNGGPTGMENGPRQHLIDNTNGLHIPVHCVSGIPWNFPVPLPVVCPMPFYPSPYWNYNLPNAWSYPWLVPQPCAANQNTTGGWKPEYPLGKHSRNGELIKEKGQEDEDKMESKKSERSIVVAKTLRIDDPNEAAKSSIWETLGIEYKAASREGLLKALQPRGSEGNMKVSVSTVLQANPAAFSRSISFQEAA